MLILNIDDLGLTKKINDSVFYLLKNKKIYSSLLVNFNYSKEAFKFILKNNLENKIGLHFNITQGKSLLGKSSLTDKEGIFLGKQKLLETDYDFEDIKKELNFQYNFFNLKYNHIDCHHNINYFIPKLNEELIKYNKNIRKKEEWEEFNFNKNKKNKVFCHTSLKDDFELIEFSKYNKERYIEFIWIKKKLNI